MRHVVGMRLIGTSGEKGAIGSRDRADKAGYTRRCVKNKSRVSYGREMKTPAPWRRSAPAPRASPPGRAR